VIHVTVETAIGGEHTYVMTARRRLSLPGHGAIVLVTGMVMLLAPAFLGLAGQSRSALFIAVLVVIQSTLNLATRYVAAG